MLLRVGHRGAAGHAPENTLSSVAKAIALGVDFVEVDVQSTEDGHLVLMHDKRVNRTTDGNGYVSEMTLEEVRKLTIREQERIPTIEELLSLVNGQVGLILEIISQGIGVQLVSATQELGFTKPIIYASFLHAELLEVRSVAPNVTTMALLEGVPVTATSFAEDARAISVGVAVESLTAAFVHSLRSAGLSIFVYTVNDPLDIEWVKSLGVDGIISDFPDRI